MSRRGVAAPMATGSAELDPNVARALMALADASTELYERVALVEEQAKRVKLTPPPDAPAPAAAAAAAVDPWSAKAMDQALTVRITLDQQTELSQLAKRYLFDNDPTDQYRQLRHVARTAMPDGLVDWKTGTKGYLCCLLAKR